MKIGHDMGSTLLEFINAQAGIPDNTSHSVGVYGVRSGNGDNSIAVGHCNVLALPGNPKPCLLKSLHLSLMIYPGQLRHRRFLRSEFLYQQ